MSIENITVNIKDERAKESVRRLIRQILVVTGADDLRGDISFEGLAAEPDDTFSIFLIKRSMKGEE